MMLKFFTKLLTNYESILNYLKIKRLVYKIKNGVIFLALEQNICKFANHITNGILAERLGSGLQNLLQRFESARCLNKKASVFTEAFFIFYPFLTDFLCVLSSLWFVASHSEMLPVQPVPVQTLRE